MQQSQIFFITSLKKTLKWSHETSYINRVFQAARRMLRLANWFRIKQQAFPWPVLLIISLWNSFPFVILICDLFSIHPVVQYTASLPFRVDNFFQCHIEVTVYFQKPVWKRHEYLQNAREDCLKLFYFIFKFQSFAIKLKWLLFKLFLAWHPSQAIPFKTLDLKVWWQKNGEQMC
jgi:hypothetical protein